MSEQAAAAAESAETTDQATEETTQSPAETLYETSEETQGQSVQSEGKGSEEQADDSSSETKEESEGETKESDQTYTDFTYPEGVEVNTQLLEVMVPVLKGLELDQESAQKLIDGYSQYVMSEQKAQQEAFNNVQDTWMKELEENPDFMGVEKERTLDRIEKFIARFDKAGKTMDLFNHPAAGNHPGLIMMLNEASKFLSEDDFVTEGSQTPETETSAADTLYDNS